MSPALPRISSITRATFGFFSMFLAFRVFVVTDKKILPIILYQTGTMCGPPLGRVVASLATLGAARKSFISIFVIDIELLVKPHAVMYARY